jgi:transposase InsO family protein
MDFIEGLPKSEGYVTILVEMDRFSKYANFIPLHHPFTALTMAQAVFDNVVKLHSLPKSIVSDRNKVFTSHVWAELFKLMGINLSMSTAYHPQTNG